MSAPDPHASARRAGKSAAAFRTISEVASELDLPQHVLRFWESKFPQIKPMKRGGGRRYYRPEDMDLLRRIRSLLYDDGYTIKGVQKILRDQNGRGGGAAAASAAEESPIEDRMMDEAGGVEAAASADGPATEGGKPDRAVLREILAELEAIRRML